jgi:pSer/pThr/pTyr-binding forkhead associated (FHA) protein
MSRCHACGTDNPQGMNFCQNCGAKLPGQAPAPAPDYGRPPSQPGYPGHPAPPPPQNYGAPPAAQPGYGSGPRPMPSPSDVVRQGAAGGSHPAAAPTRPCPNCGAQTPDGFAFCQQCGSKLPAGQGGAPRGPAAVSGETSPAPAHPPFDEAHAATLAAPGSAEVAGLVARGGQPAAGGPAHAPSPQQAPAWGCLISVKRDGTDGARHDLSGEWMVVGRIEADVTFPDDRFLARSHARLEQAGGSPRVVPLDTLNGVFRRVDEPVALDDGAVMLLGREVLRFERVDAKEREAAPLVRHGTALFGSPPREPWGRLVQILPSGSVRDIRYLDGAEVTVGREEGDLVFRDDAFLSRVHAVFRREGDRVMLDDLDSSNGTFLRLRGPEPLGRGTHLRMGDQLFRFEPA